MKTKEELEQARNELNEAMLSLDKEIIVNVLNKYEMTMPDNDLSFWGGIHKAILYLPNATEEQKNLSKKWLIENNFNPSIPKYSKK